MKFTNLTTTEVLDIIDALSKVTICAKDARIKRAAFDERERIKDAIKGNHAPLNIAPIFYDADVEDVYDLIDRFGL